MNDGFSATEAQPPLAFLLVGCPVRLWGMSSAERLRRTLRRAGIADVRPWTGAAEGDRGILLLRDDYVYDAVLVRDLARNAGIVLVAEDGAPVAAHVAPERAQETAAALLSGSIPEGLRRVDPAGLSSSYDQALRKRAVPYLLRLTEESRAAVERRTFGGSYKGVTDLVTKYVWPEPALVATRWCARAGISPNAVTAVSLVLVLAAMALFWHGWFLTGLLAAWGMCFLDTVDGKLARVTLTSTKLGNVFDHGIDLVHPPFWYWAWAVGLAHAGFILPEATLLLAIIVAGYVLQRVQEGFFIARFKLEIHIWRRFDSRFRLITARRNPNLIILSVAALLSRPDWGFWGVAIWTALCFGVHMVQILQALGEKEPLVSWLER
jgi:phosphatidylglycerophosphate synthase